tara:strand:+ start:225 stop:728 length:504 start_codon:yes stop_codon:yes gene_type:complete
MWIVLKYKKNELNLLKQDFKKILEDMPLIFRPKIKYQKLIKNKLKLLENDILGDYLICYHEKFKNSKIIATLKNSRGLKYFLTNSNNNQIAIINFINYCKKNQDAEGYLKPSFFAFSNMTQGKFLNGPFTNMIFSVIENQKDKLKVLIGNLKTTIKKENSNYLYCSV